MIVYQKNWIKIAILNLCIVAFLGVIMRYKIAFNFPFLEQKNILHSHSHFAFTGWISHTLYLFMTYFIERIRKDLNTKKYHYLLLANLVCAYGMLLSFLYQGYTSISIFFSTSSIIISYLYSFYFIKDSNKIASKNDSVIWFKGALFFNIISSLGTFFLAYMMASKTIVQDLYLSSIYFYLHFQYNGWFFFAIVGLFIGSLKNIKQNLNFIFWVLFISCIVTYFLSILWIKLPLWLYILVTFFSFIQVIYWFKLQSIFIKYFNENKTILKKIILIIVIAVNLKFLMQLGLISPEINTIVFGTRIIVIAFLHLVLLGIISLFLLYYFVSINKITVTRLLKLGYVTFIIGIILNEMVLFIQGALSFLYILFPYVNELLFVIGISMLIGCLIMLYSVVYEHKKISG